MTTFRHPITGVDLNVITRHREALNDAEVLTVHIMNLQGVAQHVIAHHLGVNPGRVNEALKDPDTADKLARRAAKILRDTGDLLL